MIVFDADTGAFKRQWGAFGNTPIDVPLPARRRWRRRRGGSSGGGRGRGAPAPDIEGLGSGQFGGPVHAVKVSNDGLVYVADRPNRRVQVFTPDGKYVTQVFINRDGPSTHRAGLAFSPDTAAAVPLRRRLRQLTHRCARAQEPALLYQFGQRSEKPGDFQGLHHIAIDSKGNIIPARWPRAHASSASSSKDCRTRCRPTPMPSCGASTGQRATRAVTFPAPGQARGGYPTWASTMASGTR